MPAADTDCLTSPRDLIRWAASRFAEATLTFAHGTDNALDEAFHLVVGSLNLPFEVPAVYLEARLTDAERDLILARIEQRITEQVPVAYLLGRATFCGLEFTVNRDVLVPRSPIAEMIAEEYQPWLPAEPETILDLCTGSGCIGIATAMVFPEARVDLADVDEAALRVARDNIQRHGLADRVEAVRSDLLDGLAGRRYDLIVCNPPYVPTAECDALPAEFRAEPRLGLEAGADGMDLVVRLMAQAADHLTEHGVLIVEVGAYIDEFDARFGHVEVMWPDFEHGGEGVFVVTRDALLAAETRNVG